MSSTLLNASINHSVTMEQKILEGAQTKGADSVHSSIERAITNVLFNVRADYLHKDLQTRSQIS